jgi:DNA-directed RNA polymerase specialized sigma24 family protein
MNYNELHNYCKNIARGWGDDLYQHTMLIILTNKNTYQAEEPIAYAKRIAFNQWVNPKSTFNNEHKPKPICLHTYAMVYGVEPTHGNMYATEVERYINEPATTKREWFIKRVWIEYVRAGSTRKLAHAVGINHNTIAKTIKTFKQIINERIEHCHN